MKSPSCIQSSWNQLLLDVKTTGDNMFVWSCSQTSDGPVTDQLVTGNRESVQSYYLVAETKLTTEDATDYSLYNRTITDFYPGQYPPSTPPPPTLVSYDEYPVFPVNIKAGWWRKFFSKSTRLLAATLRSHTCLVPQISITLRYLLWPLSIEAENISLKVDLEDTVQTRGPGGHFRTTCLHIKAQHHVVVSQATQLVINQSFILIDEMNGRNRIIYNTVVSWCCPYISDPCLMG